MKFKWILPLLFLALIFLAPTFRVMSATNQDSDNSSSDANSSDVASSEDKKGEDSKDLKDSKDSDSNDQEKDQEKDSDNDGVEDEREKADERELNVNFKDGDSELKIESTLKSGASKNKFEFKLQAQKKIEFEFKFKKEANDTESKVSLKFEFRRLVEFVDNTSNPSNILNGFDGNDTVVQKVDFRDFTWKLYVDQQLVGQSTLYKIVANTTQGDMVIQYTFFISTGYVLTEGNSTLLQPSSVKFNVEISNFAFNQTDSMLAAELKMKHKTGSETDKKIEDSTEDEVDGLANGDEQEIKYSNSSVDSFFSWIKQYKADGVNKTIVVSPVRDDHEDESSNAKMYFNFVQAKKIFWDPKVGVTRATTSSYVPAGASATPGFELLTLVLLIPLVGFFRRKRRSS